MGCLTVAASDFVDKPKQRARATDSVALRIAYPFDNTRPPSRSMARCAVVKATASLPGPPFFPNDANKSFVFSLPVHRGVREK
jgi:hypothetical protein